MSVTPTEAVELRACWRELTQIANIRQRLARSDSAEADGLRRECDERSASIRARITELTAYDDEED